MRENGPMSGMPTVSLVVASCGERGQLDAWLSALGAGAGGPGADVVVVRWGDEAELKALAERHPGVRFVGCASDASVPARRAAGMRAALGDIVVLTDDRHAGAGAWLEELRSAHRGAGTT